MLADRELIDWDDHVTKYLPWFKLSTKLLTDDVRIRDILSHRVGLKSFGADPLWLGSKYTRREILEKMAYFPQHYPLRSHFTYSNPLYIVAGEIIEAVTDTTWDDFVKEHIFKPLKMTHSNTSVTKIKKGDNFASNHYVEPGKKTVLMPLYNCDNLGSSAAINSNVRDMSNWLMMQLNEGVFDGKRLISAFQINEVRKPHVNRSYQLMGDNFELYGMGWSIIDHEGYKVIMHGGAMSQMRSSTCLVPKLGVGIVVLTNSNNRFYGKLSMAVIDLWLGKKLSNKSEEAYKSYGKFIKYLNFIKRPILSLDKYVGLYGGEAYDSVKVSLKNHKLSIDFLNSPLFKCEIKRKSYNSFALKILNRPDFHEGKVEFILNEDGEVYKMQLHFPYSFDFTELELLKKSD